jgi:hypothetical protein
MAIIEAASSNSMDVTREETDSDKNMSSMACIEIVWVFTY